MTDRNEALRLADAARIAELEQALDRLQGNYLIAFERGRIAGIAELEKEALAKPFAPDSAGYRQGLEDGKREGQAERDQLRAEVERLRADAERYRWLRDNLESEWAICEWQDDPDGLGYYRDARAPEFVDAAIDRARTTHKDEG